MSPRFRQISTATASPVGSQIQTARAASTSLLEPHNPDRGKAPVMRIQLSHLQQFSRGIQEAGKQILQTLMGSGRLLAFSFL